MVTNRVEKDREKCAHYWPDESDPVVYGEVKVIIHFRQSVTDLQLASLTLGPCDFAPV